MTYDFRLDRTRNAARKTIKGPPKTTFQVDTDHQARFLGGEFDKRTYQDKETWVLETIGEEDRVPVDQVVFFRRPGEPWSAWTGDVWRPEKRKLRQLAAEKRTQLG